MKGDRERGEFSIPSTWELEVGKGCARDIATTRFKHPYHAPIPNATKKKNKKKKNPEC